jgi:hypothetical protein
MYSVPQLEVKPSKLGILENIKMKLSSIIETLSLLF